MDFKTIKSALSKPFAPEDLEWRLQNTNKNKTGGFAVPYVTNRAIQDRLDDVVGPENWRNEFKPWHSNGKKDAQICGISIYLEERKEWITKWDGAEDTDIESVKGGLSDSMKRAAVQWGVGRVLYKMDLVWVDIEQRGNSYVIAQKDRPKLDKAYLDMLRKLRLEPAQPGGLQSLLTPGGDAGQQNNGAGAPPQRMAPPAQNPTPTQTRARQTPPPAQNPQGNIVPMPTAQRPVCEYKVIDVNVQPGMHGGQITSLKLLSRENKEIRAYFNGVDAALIPGAGLAEVNMTVNRQNSVVFYVLNSYRVIPLENRAA